MLSFKICHECFPAWSTSHFYLLQYLPQCKCHAFFSLQVIFLKGCKVYRVNNKQRYICQLTDIWSKHLFSNILMQYVRFRMFNNSRKPVLVICPQCQYGYLPSNIHIEPRIKLPVSAQWCQTLYVKVQGKMVYKI